MLSPAVAASPLSAEDAEAEVIFFDDFSGPELDRTKWNVEVSGDVYNNEQQAYIDSKDTVFIAPGETVEGATNGALVIHPRRRPGFTTPQGRKFDFVSGRLNTRGKLEIVTGTIAARMRMPAAEGVWPAFWTLGTGGWPSSGEIDIMEYIGEREWVGVAVHGPGYSGETPIVNRFLFPPGEDATGWHEYSVDWTDQAMVFWVDGRATYRASRKMIEHFGDWVFEAPQFIVVNCALGGGYPFKNNLVRDPYHGLPAETVERIGRNELRVEVDWVKVSRAK